MVLTHFGRWDRFKTSPSNLAPFSRVRHHAKASFNSLAVHSGDFCWRDTLFGGLPLALQVASGCVVDSERYLFRLGIFVRHCVCVDWHLWFSEALRMMSYDEFDANPRAALDAAIAVVLDSEHHNRRAEKGSKRG